MNDFGIVLSSRIRLARNLNMPFRHCDAKEVAGAALRVLGANDYKSINVTDNGNIETSNLIEKHLISKELSQNNGVVLVRNDEKVSIMVGEEDHIREQCTLKGLSLREAYDTLKPVDSMLSNSMGFAFHSTFGYMTTCLTNVGTGMRASAMMFLPALSMTETLNRCIGSVTRLNMAVRGAYGERTKAEGFIYQISNQKTLGITENDIIASVINVAEHLIESEIKAREALIRSDAVGIKDRILRSYGQLCNCFTISKSEFMELLAFVKLGVYYNIFSCADIRELDDVAAQIQPASLCINNGRFMDSNERDMVRATYGEKIAKIVMR